jgi:hypothetical protein
MLPTILLAVAATTVFPAPGTYRYTASLNGERLGEWSVSVKSESGDTEIDESSAASFGGMQLSATASLVLGPDLAPMRYAGTYRAPGRNPSVSVALTPTSATVAGLLTSQPQQLPLQANTRHFVVIEPGLLAGLFALPAQLDSWKDSTLTWVTPTTAQAQTLTTNAQASPVRPAGVLPQDAVLSIDRPVTVTIWYDPATFVPDEIIAPAQNAVLTRERS